MGRLPLLLTICALFALASGQVVEPVKEVNVSKDDPPTGQFHDSPFTVGPNPNNSNSTTMATTTSVKPTTIKPTDPTTPPITSTPVPRTTTTTAKTTTVPTEPTPPLPTKPTPPPPTPAPPKPPANVDPPTGDWNITYVKPANGSCIFAKMAIQIEVPYYTKDNKTWHAYVDVPKNATATGNCTTEYLKLTWANNSIEFDFSKKPNTTWYVVEVVKLNLTKDEKFFPNMDNSSQAINLVYGHALFNTTEKMSYKCAKIQTFNLTMPSSNLTMGYMHIGHLQLQAFAANNSIGFADAIDCEPPGTSDVVPIAAGCALAALIIIVLGAYLIGRRRSLARGYLSMFTETKREEDYIPMKNLSCFN